MPAAIPLILAAVFALSGVALMGVSWASWTGKLHRNRFAGVRTPATMRSDEAFQIGNKVAAPGIAAAGLIMLVVAVGVLALPFPLGTAAASVFGSLGVLVPVGYGAYVGNKAASRLAEPPSVAPTCPYSAQACADGGCGDKSEGPCERP